MTFVRKLLMGLLVLVVAGVLVWRWADGWAPDRADYAVQGFTADPDDAALPWSVLGARADFVYLVATTGARDAAANFLRVRDEASAAGLAVGAIHRFAVCQPGDEQATNLLAHLPRDARELPLAVELDAAGCDRLPSTPALVRQLSAFLTVAEAGQAKPAVLKLSPEMAARYPLAGRLDRPLWLSRRFRQPAGERVWELWEANPARHLPGIGRPLAWSVARPDERGT